MATFTKLAPRKSAGYSEPAVAGVDQRLIELTILRKTHHQLRDPAREIVSLDLPCMEGLAVARDQILEVCALGGLRTSGGIS